MSRKFTLTSFIEAINTLSIGKTYSYASVGRSSTGACQLVAIDSESGAIQYRRNSSGPIDESTRVEHITGANVARLASALNSRNAVEVNALYGGSGNFRSALEALIANTGEIFVCQIDGKKHIFWNPDDSHPVGQVTVVPAPPAYNHFASSNGLLLSVAFSRPDILAAIRTKPFILLAGISGTGKSRMVRQLARGCCPRYEDELTKKDYPLYNERKPGNFEMIPVRPNWHDSSQLLGYESRVSGKAEFVVKPFVRFLARAWLYEEEGIPFFLCLDEMNLAPVEQYFAEYLSVIESRKTVDGKIVTDPLVTFPNEELLREAFKDIYKDVEHDRAEKLIEKFIAEGGISIPRNFVVMGTVNMDETTFSFSRKVLDRAMSFELNEVDMDKGLEENPDIDFGSIGTGAATCAFTQGHEVYAVARDNCDKIKGFLVEVNRVLEQTPFKIAYRTRNEIMIYCHERMKDGTPLAQALDEAASMKILSRVEGDKRRLVVRDKTLAAYDGKGLLESLLDAILKGLKAVRGGEAEYTESAVCSTKLKEMMGQLENGYTSFWTR